MFLSDGRSSEDQRKTVRQTVGSPSWQNILLILSLLTVSVAGAWYLWDATGTFGIGVENDAAVYIAGANHWLAGLGVSWRSGGLEIRPIVHYPPLFSLLIAGVMTLGLDAFEAARILSVVVYGLNGLVMGLTLRRLARSGLMALAGAVLLLVSPAIFRLHCYAMTDGPYLLLSMIAIFLMASYLRGRRSGFLLASGLAAGLAYLLRYVGVALILVLALTLVLGLKAPVRRRLAPLVTFLSTSLVPIGVWFARNAVLTGSFSDLRPVLHGQHAAPFSRGFQLMADWFLPGIISRWANSIPGLNAASVCLVGALVFVVGVILLLGRGPRWLFDNEGPQLLGVHGLHLMPYVVVLYASAAIAYPPAAVDERTLAPAYVSAIVIVISGLAILWERRSLLLRVLVGAVCIVLIYNKATWTAGLAERVRNDGLGYTGAAARSSETLAAVAALDPSVIYTNYVPMLYLRLGRYAYDLPEEVEVPRADIDRNPESVSSYRERLRSTPGAVVVLFGGAEVLPGGEPFAPFTAGLDLIGSYADGAIYRASGR
jgi:4-amino-4-deoxy-L-arabinose transferase-like glycosyltransferase